jgi:hypothetical protein
LEEAVRATEKRGMITRVCTLLWMLQRQSLLLKPYIL